MDTSPDLPSGSYGVIYADPPWSYENGTVPNGGVDQHYDTMDVEDIKSINVPAAEDSILYLWATVTHLPEALEVMESWGYEYKTQAVWDKKSVGVGYWFRGQHELLLLGVRGDVSPPSEEVRRSSLFEQERGSHSEKPPSVRWYIERAHPDMDKLELFARDGTTEWDLWGDETPDSKQERLL